MKNVCFIFVACLVLLGLSCQKKNKAPDILQLNASKVEVFTSDTILVSCEAVDADKDSLTYNWTTTGGMFTPAPAGAYVSWIAPETEGGFTIKVAVSDGVSTKVKELEVTVKKQAAPYAQKEEPVKEPVISPSPKTGYQAFKGYTYKTVKIGAQWWFAEN